VAAPGVDSAGPLKGSDPGRGVNVETVGNAPNRGRTQEGTPTRLVLPEGIVEAATVCPHCGARNPHHVHPSLAPPADGDLTVCWPCGKVLAFVLTPLGVVTGLRALDGAELAEALAASDVRAALAARAESYTPMEALELRRAGGRYR
jgi:hypothetical protein